MGDQLLKKYLDEYSRAIGGAEYNLIDGHLTDSDVFIGNVLSRMSAMKKNNTVFFIGNGGSAGICSHMATDFNKNGKVHALALNDSSALTCVGNDFGFDNVFSEQLKWHGKSGDILIAISSSGESRDILSAVPVARNRNMTVITFSGFNCCNKLRTAGDWNCYIPSNSYGFVETAHAQLIHAILDIHMGWKP